MRILLLIWVLLVGLTDLSAQNAGWTGSEQPAEINAALIQDVNAMPGIKVFPNPVTDKWFTVEVSDQNIQEIRLTNIAGTAVYIRKFQGMVNRHRVALENIPSGIYLLRVTTDTNQARTTKLLVKNQ
ncbi:MAG TPA: hypothetical protein DCY35_01045 [Prolixibacteraceae bacterium]|nr:hypothetical protein [Prolixibacteraceae bacterium]